MNLMEKYLARMTNNKEATESPNKPLSSHETGQAVQDTERTGLGRSVEVVYCSWIKKGVPRDECFKPLSCFHRDENDKPRECEHLKTFIRLRNKELGLNG